ncbi:uncharacterized membrane protein [[Candida] jaroonii]|uniref:Uncharacterized membrane protein n=1 Tax=[Candida] jaroonii TaxID=467808 RepID=A0ACA9YED7_9ASCO|nr:uncharacterized membrane protein [[Candida] jaroonii]
MSDNLNKRLLTLFISVLVGLTSGTPYLYGVYSVQLVQKVGLTASDAASISLSTNIGGSVGGLFAGVIIDQLGPRLAAFIGSVGIFVGYFGLYTIYVKTIANLSLICISASIMGFGSVNTYYSALKLSQANFPHHKGTASAFPVSFYGLSATMFSAIAARFFNHDTGGLLRFLAISCGLTTFFGAFFFQIHIDHDDHEDEENTNLLNSNDNGYNTIEESPVIESDDDDSKSFTGSFSFWGVGSRSHSGSSASSMVSDYVPVQDERPALNSRTNSFNGNTQNVNRKASFGNLSKNSSFTNLAAGMSSSNSVPVSNDLNSKVNLNPNQYSNQTHYVKIKVKKQKTPWEIFKMLFSSKEFLIHYLLIALFSGTCQTYIYSVGFIVTAQTNYKGGLATNPSVEQVQSLQVSIISIGSFLGRLSSGIISDIVHKKLKAQRSWMLVVFIFSLASGHYITMTNSGNLSLLSLASALTGSSYGLVFGVYPAIIADNFGTKTFTTAWGLICTGPLVLFYNMERYFGHLYDRNSDPATGLCYKGSGCYDAAFKICFYLTSIMLITNFILIYIQHKKEKSRGI